MQSMFGRNLFAAGGSSIIWMKGGFDLKEELISVIMSVYNEKEEWLRKSIESILNQTYQNIQFIVVLDNPQNRLLRRVILEYRQQDERLFFVENQTNIGLVASLNKALQYVQGEYVARMDADDVSDRERLRIQIMCMKKTRADFIMSSIDFIREDGEVVRGISDEAFGSKQVAEIMKYGNIAHHPTWLLRKEVYSRLKGYRDIRYCEDMEFVLRAIQEGFQVVKSGDHVVQYRMRESGISKSYTMEQAMKARYIRQKYADQEHVWEITEQELNQKFSEYTKKQKQKFDQADRQLERFCMDMAQGKWICCAGATVYGFITNGYFRMLFVEYFKSYCMRKRLAGQGI